MLITATIPTGNRMIEVGPLFSFLSPSLKNESLPYSRFTPSYSIWSGTVFYFILRPLFLVISSSIMTHSRSSVTPLLEERSLCPSNMLLLSITISKKIIPFIFSITFVHVIRIIFEYFFHDFFSFIGRRSFELFPSYEE